MKEFFASLIVILVLASAFVLAFYGSYVFLGKTGTTIISLIILIFFSYGWLRDFYFTWKNK